MKKIIFITESLIGIGGVVRVISNWSNFFSDKGYDVETVSVYDGKPYFPLNKNVKFSIINFKFRYKLLKFIDIIPNTLKMYFFLKNRKNSNLIVNKSLYIEPLWILRKLGLFKDINLVYFMHGGSKDIRDFYLSNRMTAHRVGMIFKAFDKVVCLYDNEDNYPKIVNRNKLYFINNTLSFDISNITLESKKNIVLYIGRVTKNKGVRTLIDAWNQLPNNYQWELYIVGDGDDKGNLEKYVDTHHIKNIKFFSGTTDVKNIYEKAKIFVSPSLIEGFGLTIIEAMACKCAVITSNTAGGNYLVKNNITGKKFNIGDVDSLSKIIFELITDEEQRKTLINNAYQFVQGFTLNAMGENWHDVIE